MLSQTVQAPPPPVPFDKLLSILSDTGAIRRTAVSQPQPQPATIVPIQTIRQLKHGARLRKLRRQTAKHQTKHVSDVSPASETLMQASETPGLIAGNKSVHAAFAGAEPAPKGTDERHVVSSFTKALTKCLQTGRHILGHTVFDDIQTELVAGALIPALQFHAIVAATAQQIGEQAITSDHFVLLAQLTADQYPLSHQAIFLEFIALKVAQTSQLGGTTAMFLATLARDSPTMWVDYILSPMLSQIESRAALPENASDPASLSLQQLKPSLAHVPPGSKSLALTRLLSLSPACAPVTLDMHKALAALTPDKLHVSPPSLLVSWIGYFAAGGEALAGPLDAVLKTHVATCGDREVQGQVVHIVKEMGWKTKKVDKTVKMVEKLL